MSAREPTVLQKLTIIFGDEGIELAVSYLHTEDPPTAGSKGRTTIAARMARKGLEAALEGLGKGVLLWGGFGTNTRESTDHVIVERKERRS
jgi:hypothetical protein